MLQKWDTTRCNRYDKKTLLDNLGVAIGASKYKIYNFEIGKIKFSY